MNKLEQMRVIGRSMSKLRYEANNISIKIDNSKKSSRKKKTILYDKLRTINKKRLFLHKLYNTIYNS